MKALRWLPVVLLAACSGRLELSVDLRSDLSPGDEVTRAALVLLDAQRRELYSTDSELGAGLDLVEGVRLLDARGLRAGNYYVRVTLSDASGPVVERERLLALADDLAITMLLTRDCLGRTCDEGTVCVAGECVSRECGPGDLTTCPPPRCRVPGDCPTMAGCYRRVCSLRQCLYVPDATMCGDGGLDAGSDDAAAPRDGGPPDGGCAASEDCTNGVDDDCDDATDCADSECDGMPCADDGEECTDDVCASGACDHPAVRDGTPASGGLRCCGGAATDLETDPNNCGACGLQCADGFGCDTSFGHPVCDCGAANVECHGGRPPWLCSTAYFVCACLVGENGCPGDAVCVDDPAGPNFCQYP